MESKHSETSKSIKSNIPKFIEDKVGHSLHTRNNHPIQLVKQLIINHLEKFSDGWSKHENLNPYVSIKQNFDDLLVPSDHPARSPSDTYYLNDTHVLRTHTSAHQSELLGKGNKKFLVVGDVYRRDEIDSTHYPVFHQMEGVFIVDGDENDALSSLKAHIGVIINSLFPGHKWTLDDSYFPFTNPSFEANVEWNGKSIEVLGCGLVHPDILKNAGIKGHGWAFGLGLERLAMILFDIPDIRLFWTEDQRFHKQFESGEIVKFQPYSKYPICKKDISMWITSDFNPNDLFEQIRLVGGDLIETVSKKDEFVHPKSGRKSITYQIDFRSNDRSLTNKEINEMYFEIRDLAKKIHGIELR